jgi:hypothetical protein
MNARSVKLIVNMVTLHCGLGEQGNLHGKCQVFLYYHYKHAAETSQHDNYDENIRHDQLKSNLTEMSESETPKSRLDTRSFPVAAAPPPRPAPRMRAFFPPYVSNMSWVH